MTSIKRLPSALQLFFCFYLTLMVILDVASAQLNNTIIGEPFISCAGDAIYAKWKTSGTFSGGHVNVRYAPNRYCFQVLVTNNQIELLVPHLDCRLSRLRTVDPPGLLIETTVLISFHDLFVTAGDRLFVLRCFHTRHQGNLSLEGVPHKEDSASHNSLIVLPSENTSNSSENPLPKERLQCSYTVKQQLIQGKQALAVKPNEMEWASRQRKHAEEEKWRTLNERVAIGTSLLHEWSCRNAKASQCLMVSNCIMKSQEDEHKLVDEHGCSMLPSLMPELQYKANHTVSQIIPLFSIVDQPFLYFQCQLSLNELRSERSGRFTSCPVPQCSTATVSQSSEIIFELNHRRKRRKTRIMESQNLLSQTLDVISQKVEILPFGEQPQISKIDQICDEQQESTYFWSERKEEKLCMVKTIVGIVVGLFIGIIIYVLAYALRSFLSQLKFSHVSTE